MKRIFGPVRGWRHLIEDEFGIADHSSHVRKPIWAGVARA
jgi:hypothetical protein